MTTGTKSLLFGVHQFIWHPITVLAAWVWLYKRFPTWPELICIIIHDWGYWGKERIDDEVGETHPELGAKIAGWLLGEVYHDLCLLHSRHYSKTLGKEPSALCWADKLSIAFEPWWLYLPRAWLSGELDEYRRASIGYLAITKSHFEWFGWIQARQIKIGLDKKANAVPYTR